MNVQQGSVCICFILIGLMLFYEPVLFINMLLYRIDFYIKQLSYMVLIRFIQSSVYAAIFDYLQLLRKSLQPPPHTHTHPAKNRWVFSRCFKPHAFVSHSLGVNTVIASSLSVHTFAYNVYSPSSLFSNQKVGSTTNVAPLSYLLNVPKQSCIVEFIRK